MGKLKILFLCTGNSCRSQMAEGFARQLRGDAIDAYSAGTEPHGLNRLAIQAMSEAGVDISRGHSKHVDELKDVTFDYVVTVCDHAHETMPVDEHRLHWSVPDPVPSDTDEAFEAAYADLAARIDRLAPFVPERSARR